MALYVLPNIVILGLGVSLLVLAFLLYEDEEGRIRSRAEDWWIRVDDAQKTALSRQAAFILVTAQLGTRAINSIYGTRLLSARALCTSVCLSGAFVMLMTMAVEVLVRSYTHGFSLSTLAKAYPCPLVAACLLAIVGLSAWFPSAPYWGVACLLWILAPFNRSWREPDSLRPLLTVLAMLKSRVSGA